MGQQQVVCIVRSAIRINCVRRLEFGRSRSNRSRRRRMPAASCLSGRRRGEFGGGGGRGLAHEEIAQLFRAPHRRAAGDNDRGESDGTSGNKWFERLICNYIAHWL